MTRWKASGIHLTLSVFILGAIAAVLVWRWYPPGLFHMAAAGKLLFIIAGVDIVAGPLLTLAIYKQGKKGLKFDLAFIAVLQLTAMVYGLNTIWQSRPVYLVATADRFRMAFANDFAQEDLDAGPEEYRKLPWLTVRVVGANVPTDKQERQDLLFESLAGKDIYFMPRYYAPYGDVARDLVAHAMPATEMLHRVPPKDAKPLLHGIRKSGVPISDLVAIPITSMRGDATMLLDRRNGEIAGPVSVDPWGLIEAWTRDRAKLAGPSNPAGERPGSH